MASSCYRIWGQPIVARSVDLLSNRVHSEKETDLNQGQLRSGNGTINCFPRSVGRTKPRSPHPSTLPPARLFTSDMPRSANVASHGDDTVKLPNSRRTGRLCASSHLMMCTPRTPDQPPFSPQGLGGAAYGPCKSEVVRMQGLNFIREAENVAHTSPTRAPGAT